MKRCLVASVMICVALTSTGFADMNRQIWDTGTVNENLAGVRAFHEDKRPDMMPYDLAPDIEDVVTESLSRDRADSYYCNLWGWVTIPQTGSYVWNIHGDNHSVLYISTDENWENVEEVASVDGWSNIGEWTGAANGGNNTVSEPFSYTAGQTLAVWGIMVEGGGGDNLGIGWTRPGATDVEYITDHVSIIPPTPTKAKGPVPDVGVVDVPRDLVLSWVPGKFAATHDVYFGTSLADVNDGGADVLVAQGLDVNAFDPGRLEFGQTYYWRVDEVNSPPDRTVYEGKIWEFTVEPFSYPIANVTASASSSQAANMGPEKTVDGSGLDALDQHGIDGATMWLSGVGDVTPWIQYDFDKVYKLDKLLVWNSNQIIESFIGLGAKDVVIETSMDGAEWTVLEGAVLLNQATGAVDYTANTTIDFAGIQAQSVRITITAGYGFMPQFGLSEVRFFSIPVKAREPEPADGGTSDTLDVVLGWRAGREAGTHQVLFSSDSAAVLDGTAVVGSSTENSYDVSSLGLEYGTLYFWSINEVNELETPTTYVGDVWSFFTPDWLVVDNFNQYDDECERIFFTWLDGIGHNGSEGIDGCSVPAFDGNLTGSIVGNDVSPFAEKTIVVSGSAMPLNYDNSFSPYYSEAASDDFVLPSNWTKGGADTLSISLRGSAPAFVEDPATGNFTMGAAGTDIWGTADEFRFAFKQLSGDGSITAKVESLAHVHDWSKAGVMIREDVEPDARHAFTAVTPASSVSFQRRTQFGTDSANTDAPGGLTAPYWVRITRSGSTFTGQMSADGVNWSAMTTDPAASSVEIDMRSDALIGLAVTSHSSGNSTVAEFSNVSTTGNVTGAWQVEAIGVEQPSNDAAPLYIVVEDNTGRETVITHPNPNAVLAVAYEEWRIPLSDLSPLNLSNVKSVKIGVGDRNNPQPDGAGMLYIDNIFVGKPRPTE